MLFHLSLQVARSFDHDDVLEVPCDEIFTFCLAFDQTGGDVFLMWSKHIKVIFMKQLQSRFKPLEEEQPPELGNHGLYSGMCACAVAECMPLLRILAHFRRIGISAACPSNFLKGFRKVTVTDFALPILAM